MSELDLASLPNADARPILAGLERLRTVPTFDELLWPTLTTGIFIAHSRREAARDGAPAIDFIEGDTLCDLLKSLKLGVAVRMVEEITVNAD